MAAIVFESEELKSKNEKNRKMQKKNALG